jgi:CRISPR/Cas system-associated protein Cas10 (large subunit of type III CRISPR-Cas system)
MGLEDDFLLEDEDDAKTVAFIQNYLPQDLKDKFTEDDLYYILDLIVEYYTTSGCLDAEPDAEGYIDIDQDEIVAYIVKEAKRDDMGPYDPNDVLFVAQGEMEYGNSIGQVE